MQQSPFPSEGTQRGALQAGQMPGTGEISLPTTLAPCGDMPLAQGTGPPKGAQSHLFQEAIPTVLQL